MRIWSNGRRAAADAEPGGPVECDRVRSEGRSLGRGDGGPGLRSGTWHLEADEGTVRTGPGVVDLSFSPDGKRLVTANLDGTGERLERGHGPS